MKPVFEYDNYRSFLRERYEELKSEASKVSFRYLSREAGFTSPNFLQLVMTGKRNLSPESIDRVAKAFKLSREEAEFFHNLVQLNQATSLNEKRRYAELLTRNRGFKKARPLAQAQFSYYANWYSVPLREMVALPGFQENAEWIGPQFCPPVSPAQIRRAIDEMLQLGLLVRDTDGRLAQAEPQISTGDEVTHLHITRFHHEMIIKGSEAIERFSPDERDISALTLRLSAAGAERVKQMIQKFRKELLAVEAAEHDADGVYQVNFQLFPLARTEKGNRS